MSILTLDMIEATRSSTRPELFAQYYPIVARATGSINTAILMNRIEYWFNTTGWKEEFYKFLEPSDNPLYREGDSWTEELGMSRKSIMNALKPICLVYKSKRSFTRAKDKFQGRMYACYYNRQLNVYFFLRNHSKADALLSAIIGTKSSEATKNTKDTKNAVSDKGTLNNSSTRTLSSSTKQSAPSISGQVDESKNNELEAEKNQVAKEMVQIWQQEIGDLGMKFVSSSMQNRLHQSYETLFSSDVVKWQQYCQLIASSKFLMGEANNRHFKKAQIFWAITQQAFERITNGGFLFGDRQNRVDLMVTAQQEDLRSLLNEREKAQAQLRYIDEELEQSRKLEVNKLIDELSDQEDQIFRQEFETETLKQTNAFTEEFRRTKWKAPCAETMYWAFLQKKISKEYFSKTLEEEYENDEAQKKIKQKLVELEEKITQSKQDIQQMRNAQKSILESISGEEVGSVEQEVTTITSTSGASFEESTEDARKVEEIKKLLAQGIEKATDKNTSQDPPEPLWWRAYSYAELMIDGWINSYFEARAWRRWKKGKGRAPQFVAPQSREEGNTDLELEQFQLDVSMALQESGQDISKIQIVREQKGT